MRRLKTAQSQARPGERAGAFGGALVAFVALAALTACGTSEYIDSMSPSGGSPFRTSSSTGPASSTAPQPPTDRAATVAASWSHYQLLTHCGITGVSIWGEYYRAVPSLGDGNGNPPKPWGNPIQIGTLVVHGDGTADFSAGHLTAHFVYAPGYEPPMCS